MKVKENVEFGEYLESETLFPVKIVNQLGMLYPMIVHYTPLGVYEIPTDKEVWSSGLFSIFHSSNTKMPKSLREILNTIRLQEADALDELAKQWKIEKGFIKD